MIVLQSALYVIICADTRCHWGIATAQCLCCVCTH